MSSLTNRDELIAAFAARLFFSVEAEAAVTGWFEFVVRVAAAGETDDFHLTHVWAGGLQL